MKDYDDVVLIEDIEGGRHGTKDVNAFLKHGWKILEIYTQDYGDPGAPSSLPHYILAWTDKTTEPEYPPEILKKREDRAMSRLT